MPSVDTGRSTPSPDVSGKHQLPKRLQDFSAGVEELLQKEGDRAGLSLDELIVATEYAALRLKALKGIDWTLGAISATSAVAVGVATPAEQLAKVLPALTVAPALWSERDLNKRETVDKFIERVYADWLDRGLERHRLAQLDPPLYNALSVFLARHPKHALATRLPSKRKSTQDLIEHLSADYSLDDLRKVGYAIDAQMRRARQK